jgi:hypothetical protein
MMDERELDRAIDAAAGAMMTHEPSRSLGYSVMARVREGDAPAPRRLVWMTAAASLVLCGAIAIAVTSRTPALVLSLPQAVRLPVGEPAIVADVPVTIVSDTASTRRVIPLAPGASRVGSRVALPIDVSPIDPIQTEAIVLSALELPPLEREFTSIDTIEIEPLTIEPLAASND